MRNITKFLPIVVLLLIIGCTEENVQSEDLYPKDDRGVIVLDGGESNARTYYRTAQFRPDGYNYKAAYYKQTGSNSWTSLHPGAQYLTGDVDVPLTWSYTSCSRRPIRVIRVVPYTVNNPTCNDMEIRVPGEFHGICLDPVETYIDTDTYTFIAGQNHELGFLANDGWCEDEGWITYGGKCYNVSPPVCN